MNMVAIGWILYHINSAPYLASSISIFTVLGAGLVATAGTAYPVKEILDRNDRIKLCEILLKKIERIRNDKEKTPSDIKRIQKKCQDAIEVLRGC